MDEQSTKLGRNIQLYPYYQIASGFLPWLPLFFLYFNQYVSLNDALLVSAAYYFGVFVLEIPSGYLSDRFGRTSVLIASSVCAVLSYAVFLLAGNMATLVIGQFLLAGFFALKSGSDNALLYDSLVQLGRQSEYAEHEAVAAKVSMLSMAASGLIGGVAGVYNLHAAYVLSLVAAIVSLYFSRCFFEPTIKGEAHAFFKQLRTCIQYLGNPLLLWIFAYFVIAYALAHIAAEFNQPYIKLLQSEWFGQSDSSALVSGILLTVSMLVGAIAASTSIRLRSLFGLRWLIVLSLALQSIIILFMAVVLHPFALLIVMFRNVSMAVTQAPILDAIAPNVASAQRATYLSIQSLAGRLVFSVSLFALSNLSFDESIVNMVLNWPQLSLLLRISLAFSVVALILIFLASRKLNVSDKTRSTSS